MGLVPYQRHPTELPRPSTPGGHCEKLATCTPEDSLGQSPAIGTLISDLRPPELWEGIPRPRPSLRRFTTANRLRPPAVPSSLGSTKPVKGCSPGTERRIVQAGYVGSAGRMPVTSHRMKFRWGKTHGEREPGAFDMVYSPRSSQPARRCSCHSSGALSTRGLQPQNWQPGRADDWPPRQSTGDTPEVGARRSTCGHT